MALVGVILWTVAQRALAHRRVMLSARRQAVSLAVAWALPVAAFLAPTVLSSESALGRTIVPFLAQKWRFSEVASDDIERLALWCREHTDPQGLFIGPPGPKTFRLWSRRCLAFNRASSPYHAEGLADWFARFREHVNFTGSAQEFARAYLADRQAIERRYGELTDAQRAELAVGQGASYIVCGAPSKDSAQTPSIEGLELLHVEGRYAVYRLSGDDTDESLMSIRVRPDRLRR
jgi:hypothetical protein